MLDKLLIDRLLFRRYSETVVVGGIVLLCNMVSTEEVQWNPVAT